MEGFFISSAKVLVFFINLLLFWEGHSQFMNLFVVLKTNDAPESLTLVSIVSCGDQESKF